MYQNADHIGRATKGAAQAYLARAYLYRPILEKGNIAEFVKAERILKEIIDSNEYSLVDNFRANSMGGEYEKILNHFLKFNIHWVLTFLNNLIR